MSGFGGSSCRYCRSRIDHFGMTMADIRKMQVDGDQLDQADARGDRRARQALVDAHNRWFSTIGAVCGGCGKTCCAKCYADRGYAGRGHRCLGCGSSIDFNP